MCFVSEMNMFGVRSKCFPVFEKFFEWSYTRLDKHWQDMQWSSSSGQIKLEIQIIASSFLKK